MNYSTSELNVGDGYDDTKKMDLTPEEMKILKECNQEGIFKRGLPMGIAFGLIGLVGARAGPLMHSRWGVKPAVIGFGMIGYWYGRISYGQVCLNRLLELPDGNFRKFRANLDLQREQKRAPPPDTYYATVEPQKDPKIVESPSAQSWDMLRSSTDIDVASTTTFDTVASDYYEADAEHRHEEDELVKNYTSYDDLRKQNRDAYSNKFYSGNPQQRYSRPQQEASTRKPFSDEAQPPSISGGRKTKYGDSWE